MVRGFWTWLERKFYFTEKVTEVSLWFPAASKAFTRRLWAPDLPCHDRVKGGWFIVATSLLSM